MRNLLPLILACVALSGSAYAAEPAPKPQKDRCEKMMAAKDCCGDQKRGSRQTQPARIPHQKV